MRARTEPVVMRSLSNAMTTAVMRESLRKTCNTSGLCASER